ncbi:MAG: alpha/beta hydrolase [Mucilaginibacter sp.]|nr:alpha/beta hydrolase [Mucilaginibacter sp.]
MEFVTSKDGTRIAYNRSGSGPAVILVDGAFCNKDFGPMVKLAPFLSTDFTVYKYDRRARGNSGDTLPYAVEREIEDLAALVEAAGGTAGLFGIPSGAVLALQAVASGLPVQALAIYEPPFNIDNKYKAPPLGYITELRNMIREGQQASAVKYYLTKVIGVPAIIAFLLQLTPYWSKMKANAGSLPYDAEIMGDGAIPAKKITAITVPSIAIAGGKSQKMLRDAAHAVGDKLKNGRYRVLKGQNHNVSEKALAPVLTEFFKEHGKYHQL